MKNKVTMKMMRNLYNTVICIGYCELSNLLHYQEPKAYSCGVYGWNCDWYDCPGNTDAIICTGYRPTGTRFPYEISSKYEAAAKEINENYNMPWEERRNKVNALLEKFVKEVTAL